MEQSTGEYPVESKELKESLKIYNGPSALDEDITDQVYDFLMPDGMKVPVALCPPPNIKQIVAWNPDAGRPGIIFAYDGIVYNPSNATMTPWIIAHERVHFAQQDYVGGPEFWWDKYITDPAFRYAEELVAHRAEVRFFRKHSKDREVNAAFERLAAMRLAGPQYQTGKSLVEVWRDLRR